MHSNNFVFCIKHNGKVLRELDGKVYLPFGAEYALYLKNLDSRKAKVRVFIDGQNVTGDSCLIVNGRSYMEVERFITSNMSRGNRFKFIERNAAVEAGRGVQAEDGLVRVEFEYEVPHTLYRTPPIHGVRLRGMNTGDYNPPTTFSVSNSAGAQEFNCSVSGNVSYSENVYHGTATTVSAPRSAFVNQAGITAPGSISDQQFTYVPDFATDGVVFTMTLQLLGDTGQHLVQAPVTVKTRPVCSTCGTTGAANARFCAACGTSLVLVA